MDIYSVRPEKRIRVQQNRCKFKHLAQIADDFQIIRIKNANRCLREREDPSLG